MNATKTSDNAAVGLVYNQPDGLTISGHFDVWTTRGGLPVAGLRRADGSLEYRTTAQNAMTSAMLNLTRDVLWRLAANTSGPAGGLWTAGPYIGLALAAQTISAATTLATAGTFEVSGGSYARIAPTWAAGATGVGTNTASPASWTAGTNLPASTSIGQLFTTPAVSGAGTAPNVILMTFATLNGGPYSVASGNTLNVTYTHTLS